MKKVIIQFIIIFLSILDCYAQKESYINNSMIMNRMIPLLTQQEEFKPEYDSKTKTLNIYSEKNGVLKLYFSVKTRWGNWQIAKNKKRMLILVNDQNDPTYNLVYLLDGENGLLKYLRTIPIGCQSNPDIYYILYEKDFLNRIFGLIDIQENVEILSFSWKLKEFDKVSDGAGFRIYRDSASENKFIILLEAELFAIAKGTFTIGEKTIQTQFDDTDKKSGAWRYLDNVISSDEKF